MRLRLACAVMVIGFVLPRSAAAQMKVSELAARPSLYVEAFGNSLLSCCSINLEVPASDHITVRLGTAREFYADPLSRADSVLMTVNGIVGGNGRYLEAGAGLVRSTATEYVPGSWRLRPTVDIGLRVYSHGTIERVTVTPVLQPFHGSRTVRPRDAVVFGVSIGRTF